MGEAYLAAGQVDQSIEQFEKLVTITQRHSLFHSFLGMAYGRAGRAEEANRILDEIAEKNLSPELLSAQQARVHLGLGNYETALDLLEGAEDGSPMVITDLLGGRHWDPLRELPRFQDLVARLNIPE